MEKNLEFSNMWWKKQKRSELRLLFTYLHQNLFIIKKHIPLVLQKIVHVVFCVSYTNLNQVDNILCILSESIKNVQMKQGFSTIDLDENLAWLTQKTEESKHNKGNFTFSTHIQWM